MTKKNTAGKIIAYHFTGKTLRDGRPLPPVGKWLVHRGAVVPCESGLHASAHPFDALRFAPGNLLHRVQLGSDAIPHGSPVDKLVSKRRKILATIDAEPLLRKFARDQALKVVHLWDAPEIVVRYLKTGDQSIRAAARDAAWAAAWAARDAARAAAWAARDAAWAARDAAWAAAWAARDAAWAARDAAWAARDAARDEFKSIVEAAFEITPDKPPCPCGNLLASWRGDRHGLRQWLCDKCWKEASRED